MRVLLVEDESTLGQAVQEHIASEGHAVDWVMRIDDAYAALLSVDYQLLLLDLKLPDGNGLDLLRNIRRRSDDRPVIILTARDQTTDRIEGLNAGADDYLVKPFDLDELAARAYAVTRRCAGNPNPFLRFGEVEIDRGTRQVRRKGQVIDLTGREWAILDRLVQRPKITVTKEQIEETLYAFGSEIESNTVEVYVSRLRRKLGHTFIRTLRGIGYRIAE